MTKVSKVNRVQLIGNHSCLDEFRKALIKAHIEVVDKAPQVLIIAGGDGAYLHTMRELGFPDIPTIGINVGSLGYYQELTINDSTSLANALHEGHYQIKERMLIETANSSSKKKYLAINDVVISRASSQAMQVGLCVGKGNFARFIGDGLIFSTPQGSTGYAVSAGGAVVAEDIPTIQITPSNPHHSILYESLRAPLIVPAEVEIKLTVLDPKKRPVAVIIDGKEVDFSASATLTIRKSPKALQVLHLEGYDYFNNLADKMVHRH